MAINREWHEKHLMPKNPTDEERIKWHIEHAKHCTCREAPEWIKQQIARSKRLAKAASKK